MNLRCLPQKIESLNRQKSFYISGHLSSLSKNVANWPQLQTQLPERKTDRQKGQDRLQQLFERIDQTVQKPLRSTGFCVIASLMCKHKQHFGSALPFPSVVFALANLDSMTKSDSLVILTIFCLNPTTEIAKRTTTAKLHGTTVVEPIGTVHIPPEKRQRGGGTILGPYQTCLQPWHW